MSGSSRFTLPVALFVRPAAFIALLGAATLAGAQGGARASSAALSSISPERVAGSQDVATVVATLTRIETIEDRIAGLHDALQITSEEEPRWSEVAKAMRANAAEMQRLSEDKTDKETDNQTAVEDLTVYEQFAEAHFEGLKDLISSFETLYASMPDAQKKIADQVFRSYGREHPPRRG
jgi:hypothetical protein